MAINEADIKSIVQSGEGYNAEFKIRVPAKVKELAAEVSAISPEDFGTKSSSRNPLIFGLFEKVKMVEQVGSGIKRIKTAIMEAGLPVPVFKTVGMFTVIFNRPVETTQKIIEAIKNNPKITRKGLAKLMEDISEDGIKYHLNKLKDAGILKRIGPDKGGFWEIVD